MSRHTGMLATCETTGKRSYANRKTAKAAMKRSAWDYEEPRAAWNAYRCEHCRLFHIGHRTPSYDTTDYYPEEALVARIRTIKPDFFTSLTIADLPIPTRLTFIGLWTHVDDDGRCVADARLIKAALWPLDDDITANDVMSDLRILSECSLITHYTVSERSYLVVNGWSEHQRINRPGVSKIPGPERADSIEGIPVTHLNSGVSTSGNEPSGTDHGSFIEDSLNLHGGLTTGKERKGTGNREQGKEQGGASASPLSDSRRSPKPGSDDDPDWLKFWAAYPKKAAKEGARKSWAKALKLADAADIIAGAERYSSDPNRSPQFTKDPTTWLNNGCWDDEPLPPRGGNTYQPYQDPAPADYHGAI